MKKLFRFVIRLAIIAGLIFGALKILTHFDLIVIDENGIYFPGDNDGPGEEEATVYIVTYESEGKTSTLYVEYRKPYSLKTIPAKKGHRFLGLYDQREGGTQFVDEYGKSVGTYRESTDITLYAQFAPDTYTLMLNYGEGRNEGNSSYTVTYGENFPNLPSYVVVESNPHLEFVGWSYKKSDGTEVMLSEANGEVNMLLDNVASELFDYKKELELYAKFATRSYNIKFIASDYSTILSESTVVAGSELMSFAPKMDGSKYIIEWNGLTEDSIAERDAEYYVSKVGYKVTLKKTPDYTETLLVEENATYQPPLQVTRAGYTFDGWDNNGETVESFLVINSNVTLNAKWIGNTYTITFDANGGSCDSQTMSVVMGESYTLPSASLNSMVFSGWTLGGETVSSSGSWSVADDVTLVASWDIPRYNVHFNYNSSSYSGETSKEYYRGDRVELPIPTKEDHVFLGWYDYSDNKYDTLVMPDSDIELFAEWLRVRYSSTSSNLSVNDDSVKSITVSLDSMFDLSMLKQLGYKAKISLSMHIQEVNRGYQLIYISSDKFYQSTSDSLWGNISFTDAFYSNKYEAGGDGSPSSADFSDTVYDISIDRFTQNKFVISLFADGSSDDDWEASNIRYTIEFYK